MGNITKTSSLLNNLVSFSKDQLKQIKGLDMLQHEKDKLRSEFSDQRHNATVSMNIILYLQRWDIININTMSGGGKKFEWDELKVDQFIDFVNNVIWKQLSDNQ